MCTHQRYGIFTFWWIINVFWSLHAVGFLPSGECWTRLLHWIRICACVRVRVRLFCSLVDFYTELEGLGYVKPKGLGCVKDASTRCARLLAPEFFGMSICTLERMLGSSLLRGELHAGMAKGWENLPVCVAMAAVAAKVRGKGAVSSDDLYLPRCKARMPVVVMVSAEKLPQSVNSRRGGTVQQHEPHWEAEE